MLTKAELVELLVAWSSMGDVDLVDEDACLSAEVCHPADRPRVRRAARLLHNVRGRFSYVESPRFLQEVAGKSDAYCAMRKNLEDQPIKRRQHRSSFNAALASILSSREVFELVPPDRHPELDSLVDELQHCRNPD